VINSNLGSISHRLAAIARNGLQGHPMGPPTFFFKRG